MGKRDRNLVSDLVFGMLRCWEGLVKTTGEETPGLVHLNAYVQTLGHEPLAFRDDSFEKVAPLQSLFTVNDEQNKRGKDQFGDNWDSLLETFAERSEVFLKFRNAAELELFQEVLEELDIKGEVLPSGKGMKLNPDDGGKVRSLIKEQKFPIEVQDYSCQQVIDFLPNIEGKKVWDVCAGNGGKTLDLASHVGGGQLIASDISESKLIELQRRVTAWTYQGIQTRLLSKNISQTAIDASFDLVYLDVPCSGSGTWRRSPWLKMWEAEVIEDVMETQQELLQHFAKSVKQGGKLAYSTCSIWKEENQEQIQTFLKENPLFQLEEEHQLLPEKGKGDGFYFCLLSKT